MARKRSVRVEAATERDKFTVVTARLSKKRKRRVLPRSHTNLFGAGLSVQYEVQPPDKWDCLNPLQEYQVGEHKITPDRAVFINHNEGDVKVMRPDNQWVGWVLEIRAWLDGHAQLLVAWCYGPEELRMGRQAYHGRRELIASTHLDVIHSSTFNGLCDLTRWHCQSSTPPTSTFYWRQTYQFGILSKHPRARINSTPVESVTYSIWCPTCEEFIHMKDLAAKAAKAAASKSPSMRARKSAMQHITVSKPVVASASFENFKADIYIRGTATFSRCYQKIITPKGLWGRKDVKCTGCGYNMTLAGEIPSVAPSASSATEARADEGERMEARNERDLL